MKRRVTARELGAYERRYRAMCKKLGLGSWRHVHANGTIEVGTGNRILLLANRAKRGDGWIMDSEV